MKQEANNDDGYETSVDHLDVRSHNQSEQGKMNQNMMEQHMQQNSSQVNSRGNEMRRLNFRSRIQKIKID